MKTKFTTILTLLLAFMVQLTFAQEKTVTGTVSDDQGLPLPGVNIVIQGTSTGTQTDFDGNYTIDVAQGKTLVFSYVGFASQEVQVAASNTIDVTLKTSASKLSQVVVTAVGIEREQSSLGASTTTINSEEINKGAQSNVADALQGKVAGVVISNSSTDPGSSSGVIIRGISTVGGSNQPLYVVDGVPINNQNATSTSLNGGYSFGRGFQDVNPEDIESMTILKGASATSLYGSRAANGAVIITTKKGKAGNLSVDLSTTTLFSRVARTANYQNEFGQGFDYTHRLDENGSWGPKFDGKDRVWGHIVDNSQKLKPYSFQKDQLENFFETGTYHLNNVAVSGGSDKSTARISFSNLQQDGIFPTNTDAYERNTLGLNAQTTFDILSFSANLNYVNTGGSSVATGQGLTVANNLSQIPTDFDITEFKDYNSKFNNVSNYYTPYGIVNPYFTLNEDGNDYKKERVYGSFNVKAKITDWSNLTYRFGLDQYTEHTKVWTAIVDAKPGSPNDGSSSEQPGSYFEGINLVKQLNHDILYNVDVDVNDDFNIQSTAGFNINIRKSSGLSSSVGSQDLFGFYSLSNSGEQPSSSSYSTNRKLYGLYNTTTFNYKDMWFITGNIRNDWSSTLPKKTRSFLYGGVNSSWLFTKTFASLRNIINYGKLRVGYGQTGVDTGAYLTKAVNVPGSFDDQGFGSLNYPLNGINGYEIGNRSANAGLKPEIRKEFETGVELEFFKNRISLDFSYYNAKVKNQILALPLAASTGYTSQQANLGTISNEGIEALLKFSPFRNKDGFGWDVSLNFSKNNSILESLDSRLDQVDLGGLSTISLVARQGQPLALLQGSVPKTTDDGKIVVNNLGIPIAASEKEIYGDTQYDYTLGVSNTFSYKSLSLGFTLDIRQGGLMYSRTADNTQFTGNSIVTTFNDRRPFVVPNSVQQLEDKSYVENNTAVTGDLFDDYYRAPSLERRDVIDKSFVKLREVVLNYSLSQKLLKNTPLDALSFSIIGRNLFMWTPSSNQFIDPEISTFGTDLRSQYGEFSANPTTRSIGFSVKTKF